MVLRRHKGVRMNEKIAIDVVEGDALEIDADVLALKYAQQHYGVDELVATRLVQAGIEKTRMKPRIGGFRLVPTNSAISAKNALFVGVVDLYEFGYREIREFGRRVLSSLAGDVSEVRHIATTVHGAGYGLDEIESFEAQMAGFLDAIGSGDVPKSLERISIIERNPGRVERLFPILEELYPATATNKTSTNEKARDERLRAAGYASDAKSHVFVAMPFTSELDDTYHYGIQNAVRTAGYVCERADLATFVGDVMQWIQNRIRTSSLVIADLTDANPNVYLEVGYAWGCGVPVVLLTQATTHLKFDVRGQRCLVYGSIRELENSLRAELENLRANGAF